MGVLCAFAMLWIVEMSSAATTVDPLAGQTASETSTASPPLAADRIPSRQPVPETLIPELINRGPIETPQTAYDVLGNAAVEYTTAKNTAVTTGVATASVEHTTSTGGGMVTTKLPILAKEPTTSSGNAEVTTVLPTTAASPVSSTSTNMMSSQGTTRRPIGFDPLLVQLRQTQTQPKSGIGRSEGTPLPQPKTGNTVLQESVPTYRISNNPVPKSYDVSTISTRVSQTTSQMQTTPGTVELTSTTMQTAQGTTGQNLLVPAATHRILGTTEQNPKSSVQAINTRNGPNLFGLTVQTTLGATGHILYETTTPMAQVTSHASSLGKFQKVEATTVQHLLSTTAQKEQVTTEHNTPQMALGTTTAQNIQATNQQHLLRTPSGMVHGTSSPSGAATSQKSLVTTEQNIGTTPLMARDSTNASSPGTTTKNAQASNDHLLGTSSDMTHGTTNESVTGATTSQNAQISNEQYIETTTPISSLGTTTLQNAQSRNEQLLNETSSTMAQGTASPTQKVQINIEPNIGTTTPMTQGNTRSISLKSISHNAMATDLLVTSSHMAHETSNQNEATSTQVINQKNIGTTTPNTPRTTGAGSLETTLETVKATNEQPFLATASHIAQGNYQNLPEATITQKAQVTTEQNIGTTIPQTQRNTDARSLGTTLFQNAKATNEQHLLGTSSDMSHGTTSQNLPGATTTQKTQLTTEQSIGTTTPTSSLGTTTLQNAQVTTKQNLGTPMTQGSSNKISLGTISQNDPAAKVHLQEAVSNAVKGTTGTTTKTQKVQVTNEQIIGTTTPMTQGSTDSSSLGTISQNALAAKVHLHDAPSGMASGTTSKTLPGAPITQQAQLTTAQNIGTTTRTSSLGTTTLQNAQVTTKENIGTPTTQGSTNDISLGTLSQNGLAAKVHLHDAPSGMASGTTSKNLPGASITQKTQLTTEQSIGTTTPTSSLGTTTLKNAQVTTIQNIGTPTTQGSTNGISLGTISQNDPASKLHLQEAVSHAAQGTTGQNPHEAATTQNTQVTTGQNIETTTPKTQGSTDASNLGTISQNALAAKVHLQEAVSHAAQGTTGHHPFGTTTTTQRTQITNEQIIGTTTPKTHRSIDASSLGTLSQNALAAKVHLHEAVSHIAQGITSLTLSGATTTQKAQGTTEQNIGTTQPTSILGITSPNAQVANERHFLGTPSHDANHLETKATSQGNAFVRTGPLGTGTTETLPPGKATSTATPVATALKAKLDLVSLSEMFKTSSMETPIASPCDNYICSTVAPHCVLVHQKCNTSSCPIGPECSDNAPIQGWCSSGQMVLDDLFQQITCDPVRQDSCPQHSVCDGSKGVNKCCWMGPSGALATSASSGPTAYPNAKDVFQNGVSGSSPVTDAGLSHSIAESIVGHKQPTTDGSIPHGNTAPIDKTTFINNNVIGSESLIAPQGKTVIKQSNSKSLNAVDQSMLKQVGSLDQPHQQTTQRKISTAESNGGQKHSTTDRSLPQGNTAPVDKTISINNNVIGSAEPKLTSLIDPQGKTAIKQSNSKTLNAVDQSMLKQVGSIDQSQQQLTQREKVTVQGTSIDTNVVEYPMPQPAILSDPHSPTYVNQVFSDQSQPMNINAVEQPMPQPAILSDPHSPTYVKQVLSDQSQSINANVAGQPNPRISIDPLSLTGKTVTDQSMSMITNVASSQENGQGTSMNTIVAGQSPSKPVGPVDATPSTHTTKLTVAQSTSRNTNLAQNENISSGNPSLVPTSQSNQGTVLSLTSTPNQNNLSSNKNLQSKSVSSTQHQINNNNNKHNFRLQNTGADGASYMSTSSRGASATDPTQKPETIQTGPTFTPKTHGQEQINHIDHNKPGTNQVFPSNDQRFAPNTFGPNNNVSPSVSISSSGQQRILRAPIPYIHSGHAETLTPETFQTRDGQMGTYRPGDIIIDIPAAGSKTSHATISGVTETGVINLGTHPLQNVGHSVASASLHASTNTPAYQASAPYTVKSQSLKNILSASGVKIPNDGQTLPVETFNPGAPKSNEYIQSSTSMESTIPSNEITLTGKHSVPISTGGHFQSSPITSPIVDNTNIHAPTMVPLTERNANIQDPPMRPITHIDGISPMGPATSHMNPVNANIASSMPQGGQSDPTRVSMGGNIQQSAAGSSYPNRATILSGHNQGRQAGYDTLPASVHTQQRESVGSSVQRGHHIQHYPKQVPSMQRDAHIQGGHNTGPSVSPGGRHQGGQILGSTKLTSRTVQGGPTIGSLRKSTQGGQMIGHDTLGAGGIHNSPTNGPSNLVEFSSRAAPNKDHHLTVKEYNHAGLRTAPKITKTGQPNGHLTMRGSHQITRSYPVGSSSSSPAIHSTTLNTGHTQTSKYSNFDLQPEGSNTGHTMGSSMPVSAGLKRDQTIALDQNIHPDQTRGSAMLTGVNVQPGRSMDHQMRRAQNVHQDLRIDSPTPVDARNHNGPTLHSTMPVDANVQMMAPTVPRSARFQTGPSIGSAMATDPVIRGSMNVASIKKHSIPRPPSMQKVQATSGLQQVTVNKQRLTRPSKPKKSFLRNTNTRLDAHTQRHSAKPEVSLKTTSRQKQKLRSLKNAHRRTRIQTMVHVKPHGNGHNITKTIKITSPRSNKRNLPITVKSNVFRQRPVMYQDHLGQTRKASRYGVAIATTVGKHVTKPGLCYKPCGLDICANECIHDGQCSGQLKCCSTGCGHVCTDPLPVLPATKQGTCPVPIKNKSCPNVRKCKHDSQCPGSSKCCCISAGCRVCVSQRHLLPSEPITHSKKTTVSTSGNKTDVTTHISSTIITKNRPVRHKPGFCHLPCGPFQCTKECSNDGQCPGKSKCCNTGCGKVCSSPLPRIPRTKLGHCPAFNPTRACPRVPQCRHDYECPGSAKCCCIGASCRVCVTQGSPLYVRSVFIPALPFLK